MFVQPRYFLKNMSEEVALRALVLAQQQLIHYYEQHFNGACKIHMKYDTFNCSGCQKISCRRCAWPCSECSKIFCKNCFPSFIVRRRCQFCPVMTTKCVDCDTPNDTKCGKYGCEGILIHYY